MGGERERSKGEKKGRDGERRREGAPIEMKVPLTKIVNTPLVFVDLGMSHVAHFWNYLTSPHKTCGPGEL